jgi:SAM-dependent methyltransferase
MVVESGSDRVARYYDRNTLRFLFVGRAGKSYGIHRQLWGPGVLTPSDASGYVNVLLEREIRALEPELHTGPTSLTILDLGCGVGGTLFHLARAFPASRLLGVTLSARQREIAHRLCARLGLEGRCTFELADFQTMRLGIRADVALAIESFVHSATPAAFFESVAGHVREGGHLFVVDDFLAEEESMLGEAERRRVRSFRAGWRATSLCTVEACLQAAARVGLTLARSGDLTGLIRLGRPRDRVIARLTPIFSRLRLGGIPFFDNMMGGDALQTGLREGFLTYRLLHFRKSH